MNKPPIQPMNFYLLADAVCPECDWAGRVRINKDAEVFHECNRGNVRAVVPTWKPKEMGLVAR